MRSSLLVLALLVVPAVALAKKDTRPVLDGAAAVRSVVPCKTTLAELQAQLGTPSRDLPIEHSCSLPGT